MPSSLELKLVQFNLNGDALTTRPLPLGPPLYASLSTHGQAWLVTRRGNVLLQREPGTKGFRLDISGTKPFWTGHTW